MKNNKIKFLCIGVFVIVSSLFTSCNQDDATRDSVQEVGENLTISVNVPFASPQNLIETDATYPFTVLMSASQSVDVHVKVTQVGGTATDGADFEFTSDVLIPANTLSGTGSITIFSDNLAEETEFFTLQIGNSQTSNGSVTPVEVTFNISNYVENGLMIDLKWATHVYDLNGVLINPTTAADLRLLLTDQNYNQSAILAGSDGSSFETFMLNPAAPDGTYYIVADLYDTMSFTTINFFDIDLTVIFNQIGVINDLTYTFPAGLNSQFTCPNNFFKLASLTKVGTNYTIESIGKSSLDATKFNGNYVVTLDQWNDYSVGNVVPVEYDAASGLYKFKILSTNNPYISNPTTSYIEVTISTDGKCTVASNEDFAYIGWQTLPVTGNGTVNFCDRSINLGLNFGPYTGYRLRLAKQ
ncbi:Calx-beta domain-containing protein [uncultured Flavobacterium sp.]|uniref:Calx-beta domain-containing protein n=1 Tax=uncultured Flavobacterium sp. TaxID=165435 RepID=UPI0030CA33C8